MHAIKALGREIIRQQRHGVLDSNGNSSNSRQSRGKLYNILYLGLLLGQAHERGQVHGVVGAAQLERPAGAAGQDYALPARAPDQRCAVCSVGTISVSTMQSCIRAHHSFRLQPLRCTARAFINPKPALSVLHCNSYCTPPHCPSNATPAVFAVCICSGSHHEYGISVITNGMPDHSRCRMEADTPVAFAKKLRRDASSRSAGA